MFSQALHTLCVDPESGHAKYRQLLAQFKQLFHQQVLKEGDKLPSSRELAALLGISRSTTIKVYDILMSEGYLVSQPKKGLYVAHMASLLPGEFSQPKEIPSYDNTTEQGALLELNSGVDVTAFPHKAWAASMRRSCLKPDIGVIQGEYHNGLPKLKAYLADYLAKVRGLECDAEQIIITSGNRDALSILSHALLADHPDHGCVWLENPCFPAMSRFFHWLGRDLNPLPVDQEGALVPSPDKLSANQIHLAVITPNRQYPLGYGMSSLRRQAWLAQLMSVNQGQHTSEPLIKAPSKGLKDAGLWVIEDDYDNEFYYQGRLGVPLMSLDESQRTFLLGSFSKIMFRGLRLGYIVSPKKHLDRIKTSQQQLGPSASLPMQSALLDFMEQGHFSAHLRRIRRHYRQKRDLLEHYLNQYLSTYCEWQKPVGGMHTIVYIKQKWLQGEGYLDAQIRDYLLDHAMDLSPLTSYYFAKQAVKQGFVLGFTEASEPQMEKVLIAIAQAFEKVLGKNGAG